MRELRSNLYMALLNKHSKDPWEIFEVLSLMRAFRYQWFEDKCQESLERITNTKRPERGIQ